LVRKNQLRTLLGDTRDLPKFPVLERIASQPKENNQVGGAIVCWRHKAGDGTPFAYGALVHPNARH
jgi:hypothetical protein